MLDVLVIGCGNIGALYDFYNDNYQTYTKVLADNAGFMLTVFDLNKELEKKISNKYKCNVLETISVETVKRFDCVCICTPTDTHFQILATVLNANVKLAICEKPVSYQEDELEKLEFLYKNSSSRVMVNYFRRFQPSFINLKGKINALLKEEPLTNVNITYQKGFLNNCSHAFDLVEFLTGRSIELKEINQHHKTYDFFDNDPTLSLQGIWGQTNINVTGLSKINFAYFKIELYFVRHKIHILDLGNVIKIYEAEKDSILLEIQSGETRKDCIKNFMKPVINHAHQLMVDVDLKDNFKNSVRLNSKMLKYLNN